MEEIITKLEAKLSELREHFDRQGGRGIDLANEIDRLQFAVDSLKGELFCPSCEARLTSGAITLQIPPAT